jgi:hypothetical protein
LVLLLQSLLVCICTQAGRCCPLADGAECVRRRVLAGDVEIPLDDIS